MTHQSIDNNMMLFGIHVYLFGIHVYIYGEMLSGRRPAMNCRGLMRNSLGKGLTDFPSGTVGFPSEYGDPSLEPRRRFPPRTAALPFRYGRFPSEYGKFPLYEDGSVSLEVRTVLVNFPSGTEASQCKALRHDV
jgi:hypothetical protein